MDQNHSKTRIRIRLSMTIKRPDNPTCQLFPTSSKQVWKWDEKGGKNIGNGGKQIVWKKCVCDRAVCDRAVCERVVWERAVPDKQGLCVTMLYVKESCVTSCVSKRCVQKSLVWKSCCQELLQRVVCVCVTICAWKVFFCFLCVCV